MLTTSTRGVQALPRRRPQALAHRRLRLGLPPTVLNRQPRVARPPATPPEPVVALPEPHAAPANALSLRGEYWEVMFDGRSSIVEDCRGLRYLAVLIRDAHDDKGPMHAKELVAIATGQAAAPIELEEPESVLDDAARTQLVRRLEEIAFQRNRAEDDETAATLDEEYERIADALAGTAGRRRGGTFNTAGEKARKAVGKAISEAIARIASCPDLAGLADHLAVAVRKGLWLSYGGRVRWTIDFPFTRKLS